MPGQEGKGKVRGFCGKIEKKCPPNRPGVGSNTKTFLFGKSLFSPPAFSLQLLSQALTRYEYSSTFLPPPFVFSLSPPRHPLNCFDY